MTQSLFVETNENPTKYPPVFTLKEETTPTHVSLKEKYLEYADPTEWYFARKMFGSYECWENLCEAPFFKPYVEQWRKELDLKLKHCDHDTARELQKTGSPSERLAASKFLSEKKWEDKPRVKRGRPVKEIDPVAADRASRIASIVKAVS